MYKEIIEQWAREEGFETFVKDHAAVIRNLVHWLDKPEEQEKPQEKVYGEFETCQDCGHYIFLHQKSGCFWRHENNNGWISFPCHCMRQFNQPQETKG